MPLFKNKTVRRWLLLIAGAVISWSLYAAFAHLVPQLQAVWQEISWFRIALALGVTCCYRVFNAGGWGLVIRALAGRLKTSAVLRIWLRTEACRWLPGSLWNLGSRAVVAHEAGITRTVANTSVALELFLTLLAWFATCLFGLTASQGFLSELLTTELSASLPLNIIPLLILAGVGFFTVSYWGVCYTQFGQTNFVKSYQAKLQQAFFALRALRPSKKALLVAGGYYFILCLLNGLALACVLWAVNPASMPPLLTILGINALAWLVGFFAIFAPGGLIVREGCLAGLLLAWMPETTAIFVAVLWRVVQIMAEVLCLAGTYVPVIGTPMLTSQVSPACRPPSQISPE